VHLAHTLQDGLLGSRFLAPGEGRIAVAQAGQDRTHLGAVGLGARGERHRVQRPGEAGHGHLQPVALGRQRVASCRPAQLGHRADVADMQLLHRHLLFAAHDQQRADALLDILRLVVVARVRPHAAGENAQVV